jgi:hypothetical protein
MAPWAPWLAELVPELRLAFLEALTALERLVGPLPPLPDPGAVEPTGLDGLRRRGPYERLLLSEWVLADELPDEFLRRAAGGEHLFHELARSVPQRGRRCLVLVDTGPAQLGGPRLAQLALLVVFARRAAAARAEFAWASLQDHTLRDEGGFRAFTGLRSPRFAEAGDVEACVGGAGELRDADEVFVVGGPGVDALARRRPWVRIEERLDDGPDRLRVTVHRVGQPAQARDLGLPEPAVRTRWLRDPFRADRRIRPPPPPGRRTRERTAHPLRPFLRFSADGNRVLAADESGAAVAFRLPEGKDQLRRAVRLDPHTPGARLVALGWADGGLHALFSDPEGSGVTWRGGRHGQAPWTGEELQAGAEPGQLLFWNAGGQQRGWVLDGAGTLHEWVVGARAVVRCEECLAIGRRDGHRFFVGPWRPEPLRHEIWVDGARRVDPPVRAEAERAVVGAAVMPGVGHVVVETFTHWHSIHADDQATPVARPHCTRLVGAPARWGRDGGRAVFQRGLLWLDGTDLWLQWAWPTRQLPVQLAREVLAAAGGTAHYSATFAWLDHTSTLVVQDVDGNVLATWSQE